MKIEIQQWIHHGGTVEVYCEVKSECNNFPCTNIYSIAKLNKCYNLEMVGWSLCIEDLVEDPKNLSDLDWQLLKITNSDVEPYQWQIFKLLKKLIDNEEGQEYITERIKDILQKVGYL